MNLDPKETAKTRFGRGGRRITLTVTPGGDNTADKTEPHRGPFSPPPTKRCCTPRSLFASARRGQSWAALCLSPPQLLCPSVRPVASPSHPPSWREPGLPLRHCATPSTLGALRAPARAKPSWTGDWWARWEPGRRRGGTAASSALTALFPRGWHPPQAERAVLAPRPRPSLVRSQSVPV